MVFIKKHIWKHQLPLYLCLNALMFMITKVGLYYKDSQVIYQNREYLKDIHLNQRSQKY